MCEQGQTASAVLAASQPRRRCIKQVSIKLERQRLRREAVATLLASNKEFCRAWNIFYKIWRDSEQTAPAPALGQPSEGESVEVILAVFCKWYGVKIGVMPELKERAKLLLQGVANLNQSQPNTPARQLALI